METLEELIKNKIEDVANHYAEENSMSIEDQMGDTYDGIEELSDAYKAGAKWAVNELLKDLWHPASEVPEIGRVIIMENYYPDGRIEFPSHWRKSTSHNPIDGNTQQWLYIDDLFPKEGGEQ